MKTNSIAPDIFRKGLLIEAYFSIEVVPATLADYLWNTNYFNHDHKNLARQNQ
jgi:hypothetical protein